MPGVDPIDRRLEAIQERLRRERASGVPDKQPPPDLPAAPVRRGPLPDDEVTRKRKQAMWDAICLHAPELAQMLRVCKGPFGPLEVTTLRIPGDELVAFGPELPPFNAVKVVFRIEKKSKDFKR